MADREALAAMLAQSGAMPQQPAPTDRGVLADLLAAARTGIGNAWNGPTSPITGGPMYDPNAPPVPTSGRQGIEQVRDEYMDPARRGLGVNTVLGFTESPATVGRFPMKPGYNQATIGDTTVDYRLTDHAGVLVDKLYTAPEMRGRGQAREVMRQLVAEIDAAKLPSALIAEPQEAGVGFNRLRKFYREFGYKSSRYAPESMERKAAKGDAS